MKNAEADFIHNTVASPSNICKSSQSIINDERYKSDTRKHTVFCYKKSLTWNVLDNVNKLICDKTPLDWVPSINDSLYLSEVTEEVLLTIILNN